MKLERGKLRRQGVLLYLAAFSMIVVLIIAIMGGYLYRFYHRTIYEKDTGFCRLLNYLSGTVSVDKKIIDIMTPNYDRIIEIICDKLGIGVITGFYGSLYGKFSRNLLKQPTEVYNCKNY